MQSPSERRGGDLLGLRLPLSSFPPVVAGTALWGHALQMMRQDIGKMKTKTSLKREKGTERNVVTHRSWRHTHTGPGSSADVTPQPQARGYTRSAVKNAGLNSLPGLAGVLPSSTRNAPPGAGRWSVPRGACRRASAREQTRMIRYGAKRLPPPDDEASPQDRIMRP